MRHYVLPNARREVAAFWRIPGGGTGSKHRDWFGNEGGSRELSHTEKEIPEKMCSWRAKCIHRRTNLISQKETSRINFISRKQYFRCSFSQGWRMLRLRLWERHGSTQSTFSLPANLLALRVCDTKVVKNHTVGKRPSRGYDAV